MLASSKESLNPPWWADSGLDASPFRNSFLARVNGGTPSRLNIGSPNDRKGESDDMGAKKLTWVSREEPHEEDFAEDPVSEFPPMMQNGAVLGRSARFGIPESESPARKGESVRRIRNVDSELEEIGNATPGREFGNGTPGRGTPGRRSKSLHPLARNTSTKDGAAALSKSQEGSPETNGKHHVVKEPSGVQRPLPSKGARDQRSSPKSKFLVHPTENLPTIYIPPVDSPESDRMVVSYLAEETDRIIKGRTQKLKLKSPPKASDQLHHIPQGTQSPVPQGKGGRVAAFDVHRDPGIGELEQAAAAHLRRPGFNGSLPGSPLPSVQYNGPSTANPAVGPPRIMTPSMENYLENRRKGSNMGTQISIGSPLHRSFPSPLPQVEFVPHPAAVRQVNQMENGSVSSKIGTSGRQDSFSPSRRAARPLVNGNEEYTSTVTRQVNQMENGSISSKIGTSGRHDSLSPRRAALHANGDPNSAVARQVNQMENGSISSKIGTSGRHGSGGLPPLNGNGDSNLSVLRQVNQMENGKTGRSGRHDSFTASRRAGRPPLNGNEDSSPAATRQVNGKIGTSGRHDSFSGSRRAPLSPFNENEDSNSTPVRHVNQMENGSTSYKTGNSKRNDSLSASRRAALSPLNGNEDMIQSPSLPQSKEEDRSRRGRRKEPNDSPQVVIQGENGFPSRLQYWEDFLGNNEIASESFRHLIKQNEYCTSPSGRKELGKTIAPIRLYPNGPHGHSFRERRQTDNQARYPVNRGHSDRYGERGASLLSDRAVSTTSKRSQRWRRDSIINSLLGTSTKEDSKTTLGSVLDNSSDQKGSKSFSAEVSSSNGSPPWSSSGESVQVQGPFQPGSEKRRVLNRQSSGSKGSRRQSDASASGGKSSSSSNSGQGDPKPFMALVRMDPTQMKNKDSPRSEKKNSGPQDVYDRLSVHTAKNRFSNAVISSTCISRVCSMGSPQHSRAQPPSPKAASLQRWLANQFKNMGSKSRSSSTGKHHSGPQYHSGPQHHSGPQEEQKPRKKSPWRARSAELFRSLTRRKPKAPCTTFGPLDLNHVEIGQSISSSPDPWYQKMTEAGAIAVGTPIHRNSYLLPAISTASPAHPREFHNRVKSRRPG